MPNPALKRTGVIKPRQSVNSGVSHRWTLRHNTFTSKEKYDVWTIQQETKAQERT